MLVLLLLFLLLLSSWRSAMPQWQCQFVEIHDTAIAVSVCGDLRPRNGSVSLWRSTTPQWQCQFMEIHDTTVAVSVCVDPRPHNCSASTWMSTTPQWQCQFVKIRDATVAELVAVSLLEMVGPREAGTRVCRLEATRCPLQIIRCGPANRLGSLTYWLHLFVVTSPPPPFPPILPAPLESALCPCCSTECCGSAQYCSTEY